MYRNSIVAAVCTLATTATLARAGARIDLRPTPPQPPGGYAPDSLVNIDVFIVDTGNPQGDILFRGIQLDFAATTGSLSFPGTDLVPGTEDDNFFSWNEPIPGIGFLDPLLPITNWSIVGSIAELAIRLPDDGEVRLGALLANVGSSGGILDVLNANEAPRAGGANAFGGGGVFGEPLVDWWAHYGDLTGGTLELTVVPEPMTLSLFAAAILLLSARKLRNV